jgi:heat shock protein HslJ
MKSLPLLASLLGITFVVSCSSHNPVINNAAASFYKPPSLIGTEWLLTDLPGTTVVVTSRASFAVRESSAVTGNASCNRFSGGLEISGNNITFGPVAATLMACGDATLTAQETQFLKFLSAANRFEMRNPFLLIYAQGYDQPLHFSRMPPNTFN